MPKLINGDYVISRDQLEKFKVKDVGWARGLKTLANGTLTFEDGTVLDVENIDFTIEPSEVLPTEIEISFEVTYLLERIIVSEAQPGRCFEERTIQPHELNEVIRVLGPAKTIDHTINAEWCLDRGALKAYKPEPFTILISFVDDSTVLITGVGDAAELFKSLSEDLISEIKGESDEATD